MHLTLYFLKYRAFCHMTLQTLPNDAEESTVYVCGVKEAIYINDFRLPQPQAYDVFALLELYTSLSVVTDVSGQPIYPIFKGQAFQECVTSQ